MKEFLYYDTECPKCGFDVEDAGYSPPYVEYKVGKFDKNKQDNIEAHIFMEEPDEYLMRTCYRCDYKWQEKCIDSKKQGANTIEICGELKNRLDENRSFREYNTSNQDRLAGDRMADVIGETNIHCKYQKPVDQWTKIMKALRVHGFNINFK